MSVITRSIRAGRGPFRDNVSAGAGNDVIDVGTATVGGERYLVYDLELAEPHAAGDHLGKTPSDFWRDHQSAKVNAIRTRTLIEQSDMVVVRFGDKYKQWNAAFDAGHCAALGKPYVTLHDADIIHPLKEVDAEAQAWCTTTDQVVETLRYVLKG